MAIGRPIATLELSALEREELIRLTGRVRVNRLVAFRARMILQCAQGLSIEAVATKLKTTGKTVGMWRRRFLEGRMAALYDEPRCGAPRTINDAAVEDIVTKTIEATPKGRTHWSTRNMAKHAGISHSTVGRIWRTFGLKPHISDSYKMSPDPQFVAKVRDVVGLYINPPVNAVVFSFDEKPQIQALQRAQPILPMDIGMPERQTHNYMRHGTLDLFAALNVATGEVIARCKPKHSSIDFVAFLNELDASVAHELAVHVVLDNLSAHKSPVVKAWLLQHPRFEFHFTPTYASWLNLVERFFGLLTQEALKRGSHTSVPQLKAAIAEYVQVHNEERKPFKWRKTADEILGKMQRFGLRVLQVHQEG